MTIASGDKNSLASNLAIVPFLIAWIVPTIHAAILNRDYLRTLAAKGAWYQTPPSHDGSANAAVSPAALPRRLARRLLRTDAPTSQPNQTCTGTDIQPAAGANTVRSTNTSAAFASCHPGDHAATTAPVLSPVHANTEQPKPSANCPESAQHSLNESSRFVTHEADTAISTTLLPRRTCNHTNSFDSAATSRLTRTNPSSPNKTRDAARHNRSNP